MPCPQSGPHRNELYVSASLRVHIWERICMCQCPSHSSFSKAYMPWHIRAWANTHREREKDTETKESHRGRRRYVYVSTSVCAWKRIRDLHQTPSHTSALWNIRINTHMCTHTYIKKYTSNTREEVRTAAAWRHICARVWPYDFHPRQWRPTRLTLFWQQRVVATFFACTTEILNIQVGILGGRN